MSRTTKELATDKQIELLRDFGISLENAKKLSKEEASIKISNFIENDRRDSNSNYFDIYMGDGDGSQGYWMD